MPDNSPQHQRRGRARLRPRPLLSAPDGHRDPKRHSGRDPKRHSNRDPKRDSDRDPERHSNRYSHAYSDSADNTFLTSLYAYYKLDETSGSATDASGNGKPLSNLGDFIGTSTGIINSARDFDGVSGTTLIRNANTTDFFCGANPFSFSFWVKFDTFPSFNTWFVQQV